MTSADEKSPTPADIYYLIPIITQFVICLLGLLMNTFLAIVIVKNKALHTTCGYLLLTLAIYDGIAEFSTIHVITFPVIFNVTIPLLYCFLFAFWGQYFMMATNFLILFISLDRLMAVSMPFQYKYILNIRNFARLYVSSIVFITLLLALHIPILEWIYTVSLRPNLQVYCLATDYTELEKPAFKYGSLVLIVTMCASLIVYIAIWLILIAIKAEKLQNVAEGKIHKALFILMGTILFCWILPFALQLLVLPALQNSPALVLLINRFLMLLGRISQAMNAPILYLSSSEYRKAMQKCISMKSVAQSIVGHHLNKATINCQPRSTATAMQNNFVQH